MDDHYLDKEKIDLINHGFVKVEEMLTGFWKKTRPLVKEHEWESSLRAFPLLFNALIDFVWGRKSWRQIRRINKEIKPQLWRLPRGHKLYSIDSIDAIEEIEILLEACRHLNFIRQARQCIISFRPKRLAELLD